jgi:hypothetical protein
VIDEVRADEAGAAGHQNSWGIPFNSHYKNGTVRAE